MTLPAGPGRIILINGTSSSGKTTLVRGLQSSLPELWLEMGIDRFAYALPGRVLGQPTWPQLFRYVRPDGLSDGPFTIETTVLGQRFISGMHATAAALAERGLNVIVDHVLLDPREPAVDVAIVGARNPEQIRQTAPAADIKLSPQDLVLIEQILRDEIAVGGPAPEKM